MGPCGHVPHGLFVKSHGFPSLAFFLFVAGDAGGRGFRRAYLRRPLGCSGAMAAECVRSQRARFGNPTPETGRNGPGFGKP